MTIIECCFEEFLNDTLKEADNDIEYCLLQSTVEPTIRFKFGAWLKRKKGNLLTVNLMEAQRIDLIVGFNDEIYLIEFSHLLNLLKHGIDLNKNKIISDKNKLFNKNIKIKEKIQRISPDFLANKQIIHLHCSLFSDFKMIEKPDGSFATKKEKDIILQSGALFKYLKKKFKGDDYYENYLKYLNNPQSNEKFLFGYSEKIVIKEELSLHYKFEII
jgi:hypothetical protein